MSQFPSLQDFESGVTSAQPGQIEQDGDLLDADSSDLISREQEALGADAAALHAADRNLADDQFGDFSGNAEAEAEFEQDFPAMQGMNSNMVTSNAEPYLPGHDTPAYQIPREEPEVIKQWRERRDLQIQKRDEGSEKRKAENIAAAKQSIDEFYITYNERRDKAVEKIRQEEQEYRDSRENTTAGGSAWERICKLAEVSEKTKPLTQDTARFRDLLVSLKDDQKAPGS